MRTTRSLLSLLVAFILTAGVSSSVLAQGQAARIDEQTGQDLANWLPNRDFDHTHMLLEIDFPDFAHKDTASCVCHLTMTPIGSPRTTARLDAKNLDIHSVSLNGHPLDFVYADDEIHIDLPQRVELGESITLDITYDIVHMPNNGRALSWSPPREDPKNPSQEVPMLHSQGEPDAAAEWFPCFNHPNERLSTELIVTATTGFEVVSNGVLTEKEDLDDGRTRWHWVQAKPHAPYLVSLVVGKFDVVEIAGPDSAYPSMPMPVYTPVGTGEHVRESFARTPAMVAYLEKVFDEPYPWDKYSQAIVRDFAAGAMENTSATTFFPFAASAPVGSIDDIIVHELTHQWTGDLLTCKDWAHIWLNEGWASYGECLWAEESARQKALADGADEAQANAAARRGYRKSIRKFIAQQIGNRTTSPDTPAMVSNIYRDPDYTFMKSNNPYSKGACVLHMLRKQMGDDVFWRGVRLYIDRYKFKAVETDDFRKVLEEVSGRSLERFFNQWVYRAGTPALDVSYEWEPQSQEDVMGPGTLFVTVEQVQDINADNPAFDLDIPLYIKYTQQDAEYVYLETDVNELTQEFKLPARPTAIKFDPSTWNLADVEIVRSLEDEPQADQEQATDQDTQVDQNNQGNHGNHGNQDDDDESLKPSGN